MASRAATHRHAWEDDFIAGLREFRMVTRAAKAAGITTRAPYNRRKRSPAFFWTAWIEALAEYPEQTAKGLRNSAEKPAQLQWKRAFLDALAEISNISASAELANIPPREPYRLRRSDDEFAAQWRAALFEGYANLEMGVLGYLRDPAPTRKMDIGAALRLLAAHKDMIVAERATRANVSAAEMRASIERKVNELHREVEGRTEVQSARRDRYDIRPACNTCAYSARMTGTAWTYRRSERKEGI